MKNFVRRRKHVCYPGRKIENITERINGLVSSSEETVLVYLVGTNNIVSGSSEEVLVIHDYDYEI